MHSYKDFKHCEGRGELCIGDDAGKLPGGSLKKIEGHARFILLDHPLQLFLPMA